MEFGDDEREKIFKTVWSLSWGQKRTYVTSLIEKEDVARRIVSHSSEYGADVFRKQNTFSYFLKAASGQRKKVCRNFFLSTTGLRRWCVRDWTLNERPVRNVREQGLSSRKADREFCVNEFFNLLQRLPSHYCKPSSSKLYLEPLFQSFADVYKLYMTKCNENKQRPLSRQVVKVIFDELNLALFHPRKDQCDVCVGYDCGNIDEQVWLIHRERKEATQSAKSVDKETAITSLNSTRDKTFVCCMDLQAVLLTPRIKASSLYYKTKLCVHHFTFYNLATKDVEGEGALAANEFASCVTDFLADNPGFSRYILYSDGCTYQNRNSTLAKALLHFAVTHKVEVEQKILEKGHTQMEVDSVQGCIKRHLKNASIYVPAQYVDKTESARTKPFPYRVKYLHQDFFFKILPTSVT